jgi:hypothetical protein
MGGYSIPSRVRCLFSMRKLSRLLGRKTFPKPRKNLANVVSSTESEETKYDAKRTERECILQKYSGSRKRTRNCSILPENFVKR